MIVSDKQVLVSSRSLQQCYNQLYVLLRNIIWPFSVVENIANLEISVYSAFPDCNLVIRCIDQLSTSIQNSVRDNDLQIEIKNKLQELRDLCEQGPVYLKLLQVNEVV